MFAVNVALVYTFISKGPGPRKRIEPKLIIIKELKLDEKQVAEYQILINKHFSAVKDIQDRIHESKQSLYALLRTNNQGKADSIITILGSYQIEIEKTHFNHFLELKKICKPEQMKAFEELTFELESLFSNKPKPPKKD